MGQFNYGKKKKVTGRDIVKPSIPVSVADASSKTLHDFASWLQQITGQLTVRGRWVLLFLFCAGSVSYMLFLLMITFSGKRTVSLSVATLTKPAHVITNGHSHFHDSPFMTKEEYEKVHRVKTYMDSIARSPPGRKLYDSILLQRPGLMDSILYIENIYNSKNKN